MAFGNVPRSDSFAATAMLGTPALINAIVWPVNFREQYRLDLNQV